MARITKEDRQTIRTNILAHAYGEALKKQLHAEVAFAEEVYQTIFAEDLPTVGKLSSDWFDTTNKIKVIFGSVTHELSFTHGIANGWNWPYPLPQPENNVRKIIPYRRQHGTLEVFDHGHTFSKTFEDLKTSAEALATQMNQRSQEIITILADATTAEKLLKTWPEIEVFLKPFLGTKTLIEKQLPVQLTQMNDALGLPPVTLAA